MLVAAVVEWVWGIEAAQRSPEEISTPLSAFESDGSADSDSGATSATTD